MEKYENLRKTRNVGFLVILLSLVKIATVKPEDATNIPIHYFVYLMVTIVILMILATLILKRNKNRQNG